MSEDRQAWLETRRKSEGKVDIAELLALRGRRLSKTDCAKHFNTHQRVIKRILLRIGEPVNLPSIRLSACACCGKEFLKDKPAAKCCSSACAAILKSAPLQTSLISEMYLSGMTQDEIAVVVGTSQKAISRHMKHNSIPSRVAAKRNQKGSLNHSWSGELITYKGAHSRVRLYRGAPQSCKHCGKTKEEGRLHWASVSKEYHNVNDYISLCVPCHHKFDGRTKEIINAAK